MSEHLPDVELTGEQEMRVAALKTECNRKHMDADRAVLRLIVYQQDRIAELTESLRQQENQLRTALDELRVGTPPNECRCVELAPRPWSYCQDCGGRITVTTPDVRDIDCPACGKPMSAHKGELKPGAVLWCPK